jgi:hypothetical protein
MKLIVGAMGTYKVNDKPENIFPARVTWPNDDGTVDLCVMIHPEDFPEFSKEECARGHAHRPGVEIGTKPGTFQADTTPAGVTADTRVDGLIQRVAALEDSVFSLETRILNLSKPAAG